MVKAAIWQCKAFGSIDAQQVEMICDSMKIQSYEDGETVYKKEDLEGKEVVVVLEGRLVRVISHSTPECNCNLKPFLS